MSIKQLLVYLAFLICAAPVFGQQSVQTNVSADQSSVTESEDPIADKLEAAKFKYVQDVTVAYEKFVEAINSAIVETQNNTKLSVESQLKKLNELKADRLNVMNNTDEKLLHKSSISASAKYKKQVAASKKILDKAFENAADQYRKPPLKNFNLAAKTLSDQKTFFKEDINDKLDLNSAFLLAREGWTIHFADSEANKRPASNVLDGNPSTHWITVWNVKSPPKHPHEVQINLGKPQTFSGLRYTPRKGNWATVGRVLDYEVYASDDGKTWGAPLASGSFKNRDKVQSVTFRETTASFVRLVSLSAYRGTRKTAIAELDLLSTKPQRSMPSKLTPDSTKPSSFFESKD